MVICNRVRALRAGTEQVEWSISEEGVGALPTVNQAWELYAIKMAPDTRLPCLRVCLSGLSIPPGCVSETKGAGRGRGRAKGLGREGKEAGRALASGLARAITLSLGRIWVGCLPLSSYS